MKIPRICSTGLETGSKPVLFLVLQLEESFWKVNPEVMGNRLKRYTVPMDEQNEFESAKMWRKVSEAIEKDDQVTRMGELWFFGVRTNMNVLMEPKIFCRLIFTDTNPNTFFKCGYP